MTGVIERQFTQKKCGFHLNAGTLRKLSGAIPCCVVRRLSLHLWRSDGMPHVELLVAGGLNLVILDMIAGALLRSDGRSCHELAALSWRQLRRCNKFNPTERLLSRPPYWDPSVQDRYYRLPYRRFAFRGVPEHIDFAVGFLQTFERLRRLLR